MHIGIELTKHLDIGCGARPRNPYGQTLCFGCDLIDLNEFDANYFCEYKQTNLVTSPIPFPDSFFDSVSAFDFLEHVPRVILDQYGSLSNPFVNIMSEIHRVLKPSGRFFASTPAYPSNEAFQDPTHVNFITEKTHLYFVGENPYGSAYGFKGNFKEISVEWSTPKNIFDSKSPLWRKKLRNFHRKLFRGGVSHLLWELEAVK